MDKNEILDKVSDISGAFKILENNINNISKKIDDVNKVYYKLDFNSSIDINDTKSYLKFQITVLQNERNYYENIKQCFNLGVSLCKLNINSIIFISRKYIWTYFI